MSKLNTNIPLPADPEQAARLARIIEMDQAVMKASTNRKDYRNLLNYSLGDTEDFLRDTSPDRYYERSNPVQSYPQGGWLDGK